MATVTKTSDEKKGVAAVARALSLLNAFEGAAEPLTISELARRTGLYKSTALRLIQSLKAEDFVAQLPDGSYQLGSSFVRLARSVQMPSSMEERILPVLRRLVEQGSESPSFHVRAGDDKRVCILRVDSRHSTLDRVKTGMALPLDRGAAGRVFLAYDGTGKGEAYDRIRAGGYAVSFGETDPDCAAVAAPVFGIGNELLGVLSLSGPRVRFDEETVNAQVTLLLPAAAALTRAMGGSIRGASARRACPSDASEPAMGAGG
ncbi:IclR family transcriptional regulator [Lutibaculum baratangense]|uniref:Transcriptional regulator, IclR family n=1 Tax=Lutibaculum baratangense AMV1 TaxID=631454 RepID=V4RGS8_9HYPH|nr:IclR family transcriptional regulator [Lutibaculum baratangense]ESR25361.1 Transcriptional regulator, IclR family [Lutibaculum baratangense AMV1]